MMGPKKRHGPASVHTLGIKKLTAPTTCSAQNFVSFRRSHNSAPTAIEVWGSGHGYQTHRCREHQAVDEGETLPSLTPVLVVPSEDHKAPCEDFSACEQAAQQSGGHRDVDSGKVVGSKDRLIEIIIRDLRRHNASHAWRCESTGYHIL